MQRNWKSLLGGCITVALAIAGVYLSGLYGKVTLKYTRWTQHNDFRDGCITDRDHNLTLAEECFAELARPRVSAVYVKRHLDAVQDAYVQNALYWTAAICIPVLTCVFYLVWMRAFVRDGPKPVVSLARLDLDNCIQGHHGDESVMATENDDGVSDSGHAQKDKVYDHLQQAQMDSPPSDLEPEEDYFQAWKDTMKRPQANSEAGDFVIRNTPHSPGPIGPLRRASELREGKDRFSSLVSRRRRVVLSGHEHPFRITCQTIVLASAKSDGPWWTWGRGGASSRGGVIATSRSAPS